MIVMQEHPAVTTDNVSIRVNAILFVKVVDPYKASYGNDNVMFAVTQLAQTVMRSTIGKMPLDKTFMERDNLNTTVVNAINDVATQSGWGVVCCRHEIKDIIPPPGIKESMNMEAEAERNRRAALIKADAEKKSRILVAEGKAAEIRRIAQSIQENGGQEAANLMVAQGYVEAFGKIAKESTTMLIPSALSEPTSMIASALGVYKNIIVDKKQQQQQQDVRALRTLVDSAAQKCQALVEESPQNMFVDEEEAEDDDGNNKYEGLDFATQIKSGSPETK